MAGLGRVGTRVAIGFTSVLAVALLSWLITPGLALGRSDPTSSLRSATAGDIKVSPTPSAGVGAPLSTSAAIRPASITPFDMPYGNDPNQDFFAYLPSHRINDVAVIVIHGGSWIRGSADDTEPYNQRLYSDGVASFSVNYRLATEAPWPAQRDDLRQAIDEIRAHAAEWKFNPRSIALIGTSAGGHLALDLASLGDGDQTTCAAVAYSAPTSMDLVLQDASDGRAQRALARAARRLAPTATDRRSASLPHSPSAADAPALLFAGQYEWVDPRNASRYAAAYRQLPIDVEAVIIPGEHRHADGYALGDPLVWSKTVDFIRRNCL